MTKSIRQKVEEWVAKAPKEIKIYTPIGVEANMESFYTIGKLTPNFLAPKFSGSIEFSCAEWE